MSNDEIDFLEDCEKLMNEGLTIGLYYPPRQVDDSPRSKIAIFNVTNELIEKFPDLRGILTPVTNTNQSCLLIVPSLTFSCNMYVIYGSYIINRFSFKTTSISVYKKYLDEIKVFPFAMDVDVNMNEMTIDGLNPQDFLKYINTMVNK